MFAPLDLGPTIVTTAFALTTLSTVVVGVRFYCRLWVVGKLKAYDYIMAASLLCAWALCVSNYYQTESGTGKRLVPLSESPPLSAEEQAVLDAAHNEELRKAAISWFFYRILYVVCLGLVKLSILVFYLTFAAAPLFRRLTVISIVVVTLFTLVAGFFNGFECPDDPSITLSYKIFEEQYASQCFKRPRLYYAQAAFNIFSDAAILVLPMPWLLRIRMPSLKRWSMIALFSVGLIVPVASGLRIWGLRLWENSGPMARYTGGYLLFWSQVEVNTAIICASAPSLTPLLKLLFERLSAFRGNDYYYYYANDSGNRTGNRHWGSAARHQDTVEVPASTYQPSRRGTFDTESELTALHRAATGDVQERRSVPVRHFASVSTISDWPEPKSPRDLLPYR